MTKTPVFGEWVMSTDGKAHYFHPNSPACGVGCIPSGAPMPRTEDESNCVDTSKHCSKCLNIVWKKHYYEHH